MTTVKVFAPAKINLTLHVTGQRDDGYHLLDSLVVFARDVGDFVCVETADDFSLTLGGPFVAGVPEGDSNIVLKAARFLQDTRGVTAGAAIHLEKNLPNGAGIGGGSADAAAVLKALASLWGVQPLSSEEALALGADVPVCLAGPAPQKMEGIGEILSSVPTLPKCYLLLVNAGDQISTKSVFDWLRDSYGIGSMTQADFPANWDFEDFNIWLLGQFNELTKCTSEFTDNIQVMLDALRDAGAIDADMSGSGSTCWGLFETAETMAAAARTVTKDHPEWWVQGTEITA